MKIKCKGTLVHNTTDSFGRTIDVRGIDLSRFKENAVILAWHESKKIPVGLATKVTIAADNTMGLEFMLDSDLMPEELTNAVKGRYLKCLSCGLVIKDGGYLYNPQTGSEELRQTEMTEASIVTIGRNKNCLFDIVSIEEDPEENACGADKNKPKEEGDK